MNDPMERDQTKTRGGRLPKYSEENWLNCYIGSLEYYLVCKKQAALLKFQ